MNNNFLTNILRFIVLVALQVLVFNNIKLFGYLDPMPYVLFILLYPVKSNKSMLLLASFFIGLTMDMFNDTGAIHATACIVLAFLRPTIFRFSFGISYEYQTIKIAEKVNSERITFITIAVFIHLFIIYVLELLRFGLLFDVFLKTIFNTILTSIICILCLYLIKPNKR